jgi:hypothetical protein
MNSFGTKALLRAIAIFLSVLLIKFGIDMIPQVDGILLQIFYSLAIVVAVLGMLIAPSFLPIKPRNSNQNRKNE